MMLQTRAMQCLTALIIGAAGAGFMLIVKTLAN